MTWNAVAGAAFRIEDGPHGEKHPYFVLNDPLSIPEYGVHSCLIVNASTPKAIYDKTCILKAGCHPFIPHESFIFFARARVRQASDLEKLVKERTYIPCKTVDLKLVKYIVSYMANAPELSDEFKELAIRIEVQLNAKK